MTLFEIEQNNSGQWVVSSTRLGIKIFTFHRNKAAALHHAEERALGLGHATVVISNEDGSKESREFRNPDQASAVSELVMALDAE